MNIKKIFTTSSRIFHTTLSTYSRTQRIVFIALLASMIVGVLGMLITLNNRASVHVPLAGGSYTEGIIGTPRYINPVLARTNTDQDMTRLVYSGLTQRKNGRIVPDIAESIEVSEDGRTYTFTLRDDVFFHDGEPVTTDDVLFTISMVQNISLESPHFVAWRGINAEQVDERTIVFTLDEAYAGFLDNTTIGILPEHIWGDISPSQFSFSSYNIEAIGSGPFKVGSLSLTRSGSPESLNLQRYKNYHQGSPYINTFKIHFFSNTDNLIDAFNRKKIDGIRSIDPLLAQQIAQDNGDSITMHTSPLPRVFSIFFNQNQEPLFLDTEIISAMETLINKEAIVERIMGGYGTALYGPFPPHMVGYLEPENLTQKTRQERIEEASQILDGANWTYDEELGVRTKDGDSLSFRLATASSPELIETATMVKDWLAEVGINLEVQMYDIGTLEQEVIRPRSYDMLLFGQIFEHDSDIFAYWHSTYRNDPGLNVALFANARVDTALASAYRTQDNDERAELYQILTDELNRDPQAIFLYSPDFIFITHNTVRGIELGHIRKSADRFATAHEWHVRTQRIWKFLTSYRN